MTDLFALSPDAAPVPEPETFAATVLEDASPGQPVRVTLDVLGGELTGEPCPWTPIVTADGIFYPHKGDEAVVVRPAQGRPYIAGWAPKATEPDGVISGSGDKHYVHNQSVPASTWTINHNLGKRPSVTVVDSAGTEWITEIQHVSDSTCIAKFASAFSGKAYVN